MSENRRPFELKTAKKKPEGSTEKTYWTRVGVAWPNKAGGFKIQLDPGIALVGGEDVDVMLWPPYEGERDGRGGGRAPRQNSGADYPDDFGDDSIPFLPRDGRLP